MNSRETELRTLLSRADMLILNACRLMGQGEAELQTRVMASDWHTDWLNAVNRLPICPECGDPVAYSGSSAGDQTFHRACHPAAGVVGAGSVGADEGDRTTAHSAIKMALLRQSIDDLANTATRLKLSDSDYNKLYDAIQSTKNILAGQRQRRIAGLRRRFSPQR